MSIKFTILLYSKYSKISSNLISTINQYQSIFVENFNMKTLCIDNEHTRKRILNSKKINITYVPSILVIYEDGGVEKYENNDAFNWVEEIIKRFISLQRQQETSNIKEKEKDFEEDIESDIIDITPPPKQHSKSKVKPKYQPKPNIKDTQIQTKKIKTQLNKTSIEDLEDIEENEENDYENFKFEPESIDQVESTNGLSEKRNDLLSLAAEIQKSRDSLLETIDKPKNIPFNNR